MRVHPASPGRLTAGAVATIAAAFVLLSGHDQHRASHHPAIRPQRPARGNRWATAAERVEGRGNISSRRVRLRSTAPRKRPIRIPADDEFMVHLVTDAADVGDLIERRRKHRGGHGGAWVGQSICS